jgi:hypothetical protein
MRVQHAQFCPGYSPGSVSHYHAPLSDRAASRMPRGRAGQKYSVPIWEWLERRPFGPILVLRDIAAAF